MTVLDQTPPPLNPAQRAVWSFFQSGGSALAVLAVFAILSLILALCWWLSRRFEWKAPKPETPYPRQVFLIVLRSLDMPPAQSRLLESIAKDLRLANPSAMLLSPALFDRQVALWRNLNRVDATSLKPGTGDPQVVADTRQALFE